MSYSGQLIDGRMDIRALTRFLKKVNPNYETGCWEWTGAKNNHGYGQQCIDKKNYLAHRLSYTYYVGSIGDGLTVDHLCCNPGCVNPKHLEAVTQSVNMLRSFGARTHCLYGHRWTEENIGARGRCKACARMYQRRRREQRAAA